MLHESEPRPCTLPKGRPSPRLGPYKALIGSVLLLGNILFVANWLADKGLVDWARDIRRGGSLGPP